MPLQLFYNELSALGAEVGRAHARARLITLVQTLQALHALDSQLIFNAPSRLADTDLGGGETISILRNDAACVEEGLYLKRIQDRAPFARAMEELDGPAAEGFEYRIGNASPVAGGMVAQGLGLAHTFSSFGVSLHSHAFWSSGAIDLDRTGLEDDGSLSSAAVIAQNLCQPVDVERRQADLSEIIRPAASDGPELWRRRGELFPYLDFIPRVRSQIEDIQAGDPVFESVLIKLKGINDAIGTWRTSGAAHPTFPFNVRPESRSRVALTEFRDAEGVLRRFSDHGDFAPGEGRVHFILMTDPNRIALIGHVGRKLGIG